MSQLFLVLFLIGTLQPVFGQLNPVQNLDWYHSYPNGVNVYCLTWGTPEASTDDLTGYHIYCDDEVYRFQTDTAMYYDMDSANAPQSFLNNGPCYIHVTAVYNDSTEESGYIDSAHCGGVIVGLDYDPVHELTIYPNPAKDYVQIQTEMGINRIEIVNMAGQIVHKNRPSKFVDISRLSHGVYVLNVATNDGIITKTLVKEDE